MQLVALVGLRPWERRDGHRSAAQEEVGPQRKRRLKLQAKKAPSPNKKKALISTYSSRQSRAFAICKTPTSSM